MIALLAFLLWQAPFAPDSLVVIADHPPPFTLTISDDQSALTIIVLETGQINTFELTPEYTDGQIILCLINITPNFGPCAVSPETGIICLADVFPLVETTFGGGWAQGQIGCLGSGVPDAVISVSGGKFTRFHQDILKPATVRMD